MKGQQRVNSGMRERGLSVSFETTLHSRRDPNLSEPQAPPRLTKAPQLSNTELSPDLAALAAIARPAAERIIGYLAEHPDSFYGHIVEATAVSPASVTRHLADLEANGIIIGDIPLDSRRGRSTRYRIDRDSVRALLERVSLRVLGE